MSFSREILFYMYEHGDLSAPDFRSHFPPDGECFDLSLAAMVEDKEIFVMKGKKIIPATDLPTSVWKDKSYSICLAPAGRNASLGGHPTTDSGNLPF